MDRLQELSEIEDIKQLKGRYQRGVDTKDWDLLAGVFAADAKSIYNGGKHAYEGRDAILEFLKEGLGPIEIQSMHHASTGYERIFQDVQPRPEGSRLRTRWGEV